MGGHGSCFMSDAMLHHFDDFVLDTDNYELRRHGRLVPLSRRTFDVLACLVESSDRVLHKSELLDRVWGEEDIAEGALAAR